MAAADRTSNIEQLQRFISNLWQHQQNNEFCDFKLTTNNTSIECHKLVLSSASSYFSQLLCDSEHTTNILDVTPLPEHILRTVVAFMYNSEHVIDDKNVLELLKFSGTWNLDILARSCVTYMNNNVTIKNACKFYNLAFDNVDQQKSQNISEFIRGHFTTLHESGQLSELSLKNFTNIIEHDEINVKNEDVIFSSAVYIINQQTSVEDINRCLELVRFPHTSEEFLEKVIRNHPLMKDPPRDRYRKEALLYQINKKFIPEVKPPRDWRKGIYYIRRDRCMYQYVSKAGNNECVKMMDLPNWVEQRNSVASHDNRVVIVGGVNAGACVKRALLLDMTVNTKVTQLPDLPEALCYTSVVLSDKDVYVVGGLKQPNSTCVSSVYSLALGSDVWQIKKSMPQTLCGTLLIHHHQSIYVLGGYYHGGLSSVSQYNIEDDTWKQCSDMPVACNSTVAGVVVHGGRIKVFTVDKCLLYADDTDTWTVKQYNKVGNRIKPIVRSGQICAVVRNGGNSIMMSYDSVDNVWKTEHKRIENTRTTWLFC